MPNPAADDRIVLLEKRTEIAESAIAHLEQQVSAFEQKQDQLDQFKKETLDDLEIIRSELLSKDRPISSSSKPGSELERELQECRIQNEKLEYRILHLTRAFDQYTK